MATLSETKICLFWYRIEQSGSFPPRSGGAWNNDSRASPDDLVGGIPFNQGACLTEPLYLTACGTGDAGITMAFGPAEFNFGFSGAPLTYNLGWPNAFGGYDNFDPTSLQGSAALDGTLTQASFIAAPGSVRSVTGQTRGRFYVQYKVTYDIFSQQTGAGIMRRDAQLNFIQQGRQNGADNIGGSMVQGGNIGTTPQFQTNVNTFGVSSSPSPLLGAPSPSYIGLAIAIIPQFNFVPAPISAVPLPRLICCPEQRQAATSLILPSRKS